MKIIGVIQARFDSTRLPGKVVADLNGMPCIVHIWRRLLACKEVSDVVVAWGCPDVKWQGCATCIGLISRETGWPIRLLCGPESDLLVRHSNTAAWYHADAIVRVTADNPLVDPQMVDDMARHYRQNWPTYDVLTNWWPRATYPDGLDIDIIGTHVLAALCADTNAPREEFLGYMLSKDSFKIGSWTNEEDLSDYRITLDTEEDRVAIDAILKRVGNDEWDWRNIPLKMMRRQARPNYLAGKVGSTP